MCHTTGEPSHDPPNVWFRLMRDTRLMLVELSVVEQRYQALTARAVVVGLLAVRPACRVFRECSTHIEGRRFGRVALTD